MSAKTGMLGENLPTLLLQPRVNGAERDMVEK